MGGSVGERLGSVVNWRVLTGTGPLNPDVVYGGD